MDDEQIKMVKHFKYLGSLKSADGNCSNGIRSLIGIAKKKCSIWRDSGIGALAGLDRSHL